MTHSSNPATVSDRQRRERAYYDEYAKRSTPGELSFGPVDRREERPFNPYWRAIAHVRDEFRGDGQRLLDFGCGTGVFSMMCARVGYEVFGFDISGENVRASTELAARYDFSDRVHFAEGLAECLDYSDDFFDAVLGIDILHHIDIGPAIRECRRVLKPGGLAVFKEPVEAWLYEPLRNSRLGLWIAPKEASFELHITEDERKLTSADLSTIRREFPHAVMERFHLFSRLDRFLGPLAVNSTGASRLEIFDRRVLDAVPVLGRLAGIVVMQLRKAYEA
jgi:2-polyprenyl-3-methyl-5-hydroxy-6-metoxy-1,4-benzoquinol methylase